MISWAFVSTLTNQRLNNDGKGQKSLCVLRMRRAQRQMGRTVPGMRVLEHARGDQCGLAKTGRQRACHASGCVTRGEKLRFTLFVLERLL